MLLMAYTWGAPGYTRVVTRVPPENTRAVTRVPPEHTRVVTRVPVYSGSVPGTSTVYIYTLVILG